MLNQNFPIVEKAVDYFPKFKRGDRLLETANCKCNLVLCSKNSRDDYDFNLESLPVGKGCHNVINAYYYVALKTLNKLSVALDKLRKITKFRNEPGYFLLYILFYNICTHKRS